VALVQDGSVRFALGEERLRRSKRASGFPDRALSACLDSCNLSPSDVDAVAVPGRWGRLGARLAEPLYRRTDPARDPLSLASVVARDLECGVARRPFLRGLEERGSRSVLGARLRAWGFRASVVGVDHHDAHAWTARLVGGPNALVVTLDGYGDGLSGTCGGPGFGRVEVPAPRGSVALVYGAITRVLGFGEGDEGKVMGLAACGDPAVLRPLFRSLIGPAGCDVSLGGREGRERLREFRREDVAAALQERTEQVVLQWIEGLRGGQEELAVAGGLFANVALNGKLQERFEQLSVYPNMGDGGLCVGAACAIAAEQGALEGGRLERDERLPFLGPDYSEARMEGALTASGLAFARDQSPEQALLDVIEKGGLVGRFVGRSEFGPRALGHRSILLRADRPGLSAELGRRLERDEFMPFAPVRRHGLGSRTMTTVVVADDSLRTRCPAAVHVDGTVRTQLADEGEDPGLWALLEQAESRGMPALINTSFNRHGEPIVESPEDAVRTFVAARLDAMQLGPFVVRGQP